MRTETITYKPTFKAFLLYFVSIFGLFSVIIGFYLLFEKEKSFIDYSRSFFYLYFFIPLINAATFAFSTRKHEFVISAIDDPAHITEWVVELLLQKGMRVKTKLQNQTILEPTSNFMRWFGNQFGTEQVTVNYTENAVTIAGNFKYIDIVDTKIKFGRVAFQNQPYNQS